jgi:hypothetical protein
VARTPVGATQVWELDHAGVATIVSARAGFGRQERRVRCAAIYRASLVLIVALIWLR